MNKQSPAKAETQKKGNDGVENIPSHLKARKEESTPKQSQSIPAHPNPNALLKTKVLTVAEAKEVQPPNSAVEVNETRPTPYKRIQRKWEQGKAKKVQREEEEQFFDGAIEVAEDKHTESAKSEDNLRLFKQVVNTKDVLQQRLKPTIMQRAKTSAYWERSSNRPNVLSNTGLIAIQCASVTMWCWQPTMIAKHPVQLRYCTFRR